MAILDDAKIKVVASHLTRKMKHEKHLKVSRPLSFHLSIKLIDIISTLVKIKTFSSDILTSFP